MLHVASVWIPCSCCVVTGVVAQSLKPIKCLAMCKHLQHCWPTTRNIVRLYVALDFLDAYIIWPRQITRQSPFAHYSLHKKGTSHFSFGSVLWSLLPIK